MPRVLIVTAGYGEGHNAAARGLNAAFAVHPEVTSKVWDPFAEAFGRFYEKTRRGYLETIDRRPGLWSWTYRMLDQTPLIFLAEWFCFSLRAALKRGFAAEPPDAVVSVYPLYPYLFQRMFRGSRRPFRFFTIVTDSITINSVWHRCTSDLFFVPNEDTAAAMRAQGVPAEKLRVLGFPVPPVFALEPASRPVPGNGQTARVLYMINAGRAMALPLIERLLALPGISLTITAGKDTELSDAIKELVRKSGQKAEVLGWVTNMPELVMTHHLVIGKAGGASVQEAIAARTPMIITKVVPGQEEGNARLLVENGCGAVCETPEAISAKVQELFAHNAEGWHSWHDHISKLSRPDAALRIADAILEELKS